MIVTDVHQDTERFTLTIATRLDADVERVWQLWADPRQLERWWGPPGYPATFEVHELEPGGTMNYFMTSPEGERYHGWWRVLEVDPPVRFRVEDGFGDDAGRPNPDLPVTVMEVELVPHAEGGTAMTITSRYGSLEAMEQVIAMGALEGMNAALGQIDALLAERPD